MELIRQRGRSRAPARPVDQRRTLTALIGFALVAGLFFYGFRLVRVEGHSMAPTFADGQLLLVRRLNGPSPTLRDGDVVVFRMGSDLLVKRIAAMAGQRVPGRPMLLLRPSRVNPGLWEGIIITTPPRVVPKGYLYVLGDNRAVSLDSRSFGLVPRAALVGRVLRWSDPGRARLVREERPSISLR